MFHIKICVDCASLIWPKLVLPALREDVFLEAVARKLDQCAQCKAAAERLRAVARRSPADQFWAWVKET